MEHQGRILDGDLETLGLQATLKMLALGGKTGVLNVVSGGEALRISLANGHIVALDEPGSQPPDLVEMFRLLGRIPRAQVPELRQLAGDNPTTVLAVLVQWQVIQPAEMQQRVEFGVIQAVSHAVRWERGRFQFDRDIIDLQSRINAPQPFNVDHILLEALRMADEWDQSGAPTLTRNTVARWMPDFQGDVKRLGLGHEDVSVLCLANGQLPLRSISFGLLLPEARVASIIVKLQQLGLIEVVDARLETELEHSLVNLITQTQHALDEMSRVAPEQRVHVLVRTMGSCVNGLLAHHAIFARALRGRGELPRTEVVQYVQRAFQPAVAALHQRFPRMDEVIRLENGQVDYSDVLTLASVVRGNELQACYWDAVQFLNGLMQTVFEQVLVDEAGNTRVGRQYHDLWAAFSREVEEEMLQLRGRLMALPAPPDRQARGRYTPEAGQVDARGAVFERRPRDGERRSVK
jgi:hypothetical protein